jgi:hypothetical protein
LSLLHVLLPPLPVPLPPLRVLLPLLRVLLPLLRVLLSLLRRAVASASSGYYGCFHELLKSGCCCFCLVGLMSLLHGKGRQPRTKPY